jgi:hypothetical protein
MNNPFVLAGAKGVADMICNYLNSRTDLGINCTMLDKIVLVACALDTRGAHPKIAPWERQTASVTQGYIESLD